MTSGGQASRRSAESDLVVSTTGLRKEFRSRRGQRVVAVDGLDLAVPAGGVHGFLGPNGSGKTTTIRMLLGLARPTSGRLRLLGEPVPERLPAVMDRVGAVVEHPKFVGSFTGRANLALLARAVGVGRRRVDETIARVGLNGRERERYRTYSLGMRQRLAIAAALLKDPALMVLDEPTNGLDPAGIRDIRDLVRSLAESGVTVLLSSHILAEVQQICDSVSIVGRGRLLAAGRVDELVGRDRPGGARVTVADPAAAVRVLTAAGLRAAVDPAAGPQSLYVEAVADPARVTRALADAGIYLRGLSEDRRDLESVFLDLTRSSGLAASAPSESRGVSQDRARGAP